MTTPFEIPLSPQPQLLRISLNGVEYQLTFKWNTYANCWVIDVADSLGNPKLSGIYMVTGADLLEQFAYLEVGGMLLAQTDHAVDEVPTFANLGDNGHLFFVTP
jgi:hypothetical protein